MSKQDWQKIEADLEAMKVARQPRPADEFWTAFKQRAAAEPQDGFEPSPQPWALPKWVAAAAAVFIIVFLVWLMARPDGPGPDKNEYHPNPTPVAQIVDGNEIKSLEVFVSSDGYIIMNDQPEDGTILWITGSEPAVEDTTI